MAAPHVKETATLPAPGQFLKLLPEDRPVAAVVPARSHPVEDLFLSHRGPFC